VNHLLAPKVVEALGEHERQQQQQSQREKQEQQKKEQHEAEQERRQVKESQLILQSIAAYDDGDLGARALASLSATSQALKVVKTEGWIEESIVAAKEQGALSVMAPLANSYLKTIATGGQVACLPGFAPQRTLSGDLEATSFSVNIVFQNAGKVESITTIDGSVATSESSSADRVINTTDESSDE
jgi:hypothetical protein